MWPRSSASAQPPLAASCSIKGAESSTARGAVRRIPFNISITFLFEVLAPCPPHGVASATMNIRTILIGAGVLALGGDALYDYYRPPAKLAPGLKKIEQPEPGRKTPGGFPQRGHGE